MDLSTQRSDGPKTDPVVGTQVFWELNQTLIDCQKVTIAAVNGPAVGYGTSSIGLFDLVYAVPDAYFFTPFIKWALCAEAAASFTFAHDMGRQKAAQLILAGERFTAQELEGAGMISKIIPRANFMDDVLAVARRIAALPPISLRENKRLMTQFFKDQLTAANKAEVELLARLQTGDETKEAVKMFKVEQEQKKRQRSQKL